MKRGAETRTCLAIARHRELARAFAGRREEERARIPPLFLKRGSDDERRAKSGLAEADRAFQQKVWPARFLRYLRIIFWILVR